MNGVVSDESIRLGRCEVEFCLGFGFGGYEMSGGRSERSGFDVGSVMLTCGTRNNRRKQSSVLFIQCTYILIPKAKNTISMALVYVFVVHMQFTWHTQSYQSHNSTPEHLFHLHSFYWFESPNECKTFFGSQIF